MLAADELRFPQAPYFWERPIRNANDGKRLLTQLEDSRWACCGRCQKLHPHSEFPEGVLEENGPFDRACMPCAGIVDLCLCIALTIRGRDHLVDYLKGTASDNSSKKRKLHHVNRGLLKDSWGGKENEQHSLVHECHATMEAIANIRLSVTKSGQFLVYSQYSTYLDFCDRRLLSAVYVCRHLTLDSRSCRLAQNVNSAIHIQRWSLRIQNSKWWASRGYWGERELVWKYGCGFEYGSFYFSVSVV